MFLLENFISFMIPFAMPESSSPEKSTPSPQMAFTTHLTDVNLAASPPQSIVLRPT